MNPQDPRKQILAFMAFAVAFTLVGKSASASSTSPAATAKLTDPQIMLGGAIATVLLTLISEAGDTGAQLARGLAAITLIGSVLLNGKPVFAAISKVTSSTTSPTNATIGSPATTNYANTSYMPPLTSKKG